LRGGKKEPRGGKKPKKTKKIKMCMYLKIVCLLAVAGCGESAADPGHI